MRHGAIAGPQEEVTVWELIQMLAALDIDPDADIYVKDGDTTRNLSPRVSKYLHPDTPAYFLHLERGDSPC